MTPGARFCGHDDISCRHRFRRAGRNVATAGEARYSRPVDGRMAVGGLVLLVVAVGVQILLMVPLRRVDILGRVLTGPVLSFAFAMCIAAIACKLRRERLAALGWRKPVHLGSGIALGALMPAIIILVAVACRAVTMAGTFTLPIGFGFLVAAFVFVAAGEEILWRGMVFRLLERRWGFAAAAAVSSAAFAAVHLLSPGGPPTAVALLNLFLVGTVLCYLYRLGGTLWLPVGFHFSWNVVQAVWSPLSASTRSLLTSGVYFGVEGWLLTTLVLVVADGVLRWRLTRRVVGGYETAK